MRIAAYARYSSDSQREASIDDQLRNCQNYCTRQGWPPPEIFTDSAVSGARHDRSGYLRLIGSAGRFDVIIVDDLSRFGRDKDEIGKTIKQLSFMGVRLVGVSDGVDTARKGHKIDVGLRGLMSELYLDDLAEKTHRGLTGRALAGASAGGLPYGYRVTTVGQRMIDEDQARVVRRIFEEYAAGASPRSIASALNSEGVPSSRGGPWAASAIYGDPKRGIGILANPHYVGKVIWNKSKWVKHPDTGRRLRRERPQSEWIVQEKPELAIITPDLWQAAQRRIGLDKPKKEKQIGRPPSHLFSGILRCGHCGGPMVIVDAYRYGCSNHKERGDAVCPSRLRVSRKLVDASLLAGIRSKLLSEPAFQQFQDRVMAALKQLADSDDLDRRLQKAQREVDNLVAAIRAGVFTPSTKSALEAAEQTVAGIQAEKAALKELQPARVMPRLREVWEEIVSGLADHARNIKAARDAIRTLAGGGITLKEKSGNFIAEIAADSDLTEQSEINVVAGAGFEPATFGL